jgi:hypothetical protein
LVSLLTWAVSGLRRLLDVYNTAHDCECRLSGNSIRKIRMPTKRSVGLVRLLSYHISTLREASGPQCLLSLPTKQGDISNLCPDRVQTPRKHENSIFINLIPHNADSVTDHKSYLQLLAYGESNRARHTHLGRPASSMQSIVAAPPNSRGQMSNFR